MIGKWQRFGHSEPPEDGEVVAFVRHTFDLESVFNGPIAYMDVALYRGGMLTMQDGSAISVPLNCWWTSLPRPSMRD